MNRILLFSLSFLLLAGGCQTGTDDPLSRTREEMSSHQTMHYKVTEHSMYSWSPDTIITPYEVWAVRDDNDTLRHGYVWVNNYYRPYNIIYDRGDLYLVIPPKKTTVLYSPFAEPLIVDVDWIDFFLTPEKLTAVNRHDLVCHHKRHPLAGRAGDRPGDPKKRRKQYTETAIPARQTGTGPSLCTPGAAQSGTLVRG